MRRDQAGRPPGTREAPWSCPVCVPRSPAAPEWSTPPPDARGASPLLPSSAAAAREPATGSAVRALPTTAHAAPGVVVALRRLGGLPHVSGAAGAITLPWLWHGRTTAPVQPGATLDGMAQQEHVPLPSAARTGEGTEGRRRRIIGPAITHRGPHAVLIPCLGVYAQTPDFFDALAGRGCRETPVWRQASSPSQYGPRSARRYVRKTLPEWCSIRKQR